MKKIIEILEKNKTLTLILILVFTSLVYLNTFSNQFIWDDPDFFVNWEGIRSLNNIPSYFSGNVPERHLGVYRPIRSVFQALNYQLWGEKPFGYHLNALIIHLLVTILIYFIIREITKKNLLAFLAAVLFGLHPIHTEAITFITASFDEIGIIFFLLSFYFYLKSGNALIKSWLNYGVSIVLAFLAFFTYEITLILPLILVLYDIYFKNLNFNDLIKKARIYLPYFLGTGFFIFIRFFWLEIASRQLTVQGDIDFFSRIFTSAKALVKYIYTLILPVNLNVYHNLPISHSLFEVPVFLSILLLLVILAAAVIFYKKYKLISFGVFWFFICLLPVANIIPIQTFYAEKYSYLASVGFCLILAYFLTPSSSILLPPGEKEEPVTPSPPTLSPFRGRGKKGEGVAILLVVSLLIFYGWQTHVRNAEWRDEITLWQATLKKYPDSSRAHNNLGFEFYKQKDYQKALEEFNLATKLEPDFAPIYNNLGNTYSALKQVDKAIQHYQKAVELDSNYVEAYSNLGTVFHAKGDFEKAISNYQKALEIKPDYFLALSNLGAAYLMIERYDLAVEKFKKAIEINSQLPESYNGLGLAYVNLGQLDLAIETFKKALELKPDFIEVYNYLGIIYLMKGEYQKAAAEFEKALEINPNYAPAIENLNKIKAPT